MHLILSSYLEIFLILFVKRDPEDLQLEEQGLGPCRVSKRF